MQVALVSVSVLFSALPVAAQAIQVAARVTQPVDIEDVVPLRGHTHPLARPEHDRGPAPDSLPMRRMLLILERGRDQEAELRQLLDEQHVKSSPNYHQWLTPEQFGKRFGPADSDIQAVTDWLTTQGFEVNRVGAGRTVIEFSGTAGLVRHALHTEIHKFAVQGEEHWANASDPRIPAALAPVVAGIASLNNFPRRSLHRRVGTFSRSKATGEVRPLLTATCGPGQACYPVVPGDFTTIYNVQPLYQTGTDGTGQTIAIVGDSNINIQDVRDFRSVFGLPPSDPQIVLNGPDPGLVPFAESEADLDVEWAGAVAKNATIALVVSEDTEASFGVDLSALYIVDNNIAPVMSASYGFCELFGAGFNAFYNALWEQAASEGITVVVASGDSGSATCDGGLGTAAQFGLAVSGVASTAFNVAVGGTDFDDLSDPSLYWNATNNPTTLSSAKSYIPEITWNDSCARSGLLNGCTVVAEDGRDLVGGGGGPSNCLVWTGTFPNITCTRGYSKPPWQTGKGMPGDGARDLPDVSLFAGAGFTRSFYLFCQSDANPGGVRCAPFEFQGAGGTSFAAPAFAGIMAMVNQKTGERQGNANYVLYPLAAQSGASCSSSAAAVGNSSCIFYDAIKGNNSVACQGGTPNCSNTVVGGFGVLVDPKSTSSLAWTTGAGYDLATGLGSVNAANLVNKWTSVSFNPTTTKLTGLSPTTLTHGQAVNVTVDVTSSSGTPTGDVSLIGGPNTTSAGIDFFTLSNGTVTSTTSLLPGGTYGVTAHYAGDGTYGASDSTPPIQVTVNKEDSKTQVGIITFDPLSGLESTNVTTFPYGSFYVLRADVTNAAGTMCAPAPLGESACPTGAVTLTDNGAQLDSGTYKLNSAGYTEDQPLPFGTSAQLPAGSHNFVGAYSGDSSFNASTSSPDAVTVTKAATGTSVTNPPAQAVVNQSTPVNVNVSTGSFGGAPGGQVQILNGSTSVGASSCIGTGFSVSNPSLAQCQATVPITLTGSTRSVTLTAQYSGDNNYASSTSAPFSIKTVYPVTVTLAASSQSVAVGSSVTLTAVVDGGRSPEPTGTVAFSTGTFTVPGAVSYQNVTDAGGFPALQASVTFTAASGQGSYTAQYRGDSNYEAADSASVTITAGTPDFKLSATPPSATVSAGSSTTSTIAATGTFGFASAVALTCAVTTLVQVQAQYMPTCAFSPSSVTPGQNPATSKLTIGTSARAVTPP
ncbi:MAG: hypothetical protein DMG27_17225, partial [Acidobacteria bacterium]